MTKYPDGVIKMSDLFIEYYEKVEELIQKLNEENDRIFKKLMHLMELLGEEEPDEQED